MEVTLAAVVGFVPLAGLLFWWWNDIWYAVLPAFLRRSGGAGLPPGYMGIPFLGEMLTFIWCFKFLRRPDHFIDSKRRKYGDGVGLYRTHLFGSPTIIAYTPSANKFVLQSDTDFPVHWPTMELLGNNAFVLAQGDYHARVRSFVIRAINQPDPLRRIALTVQPRIAAALELWARKGRITAYKEAKKVTFENIGKNFASFEPGLMLDTLDELYDSFLDGVRAYPINIKGSTFHHALQCRKKILAIFREEMEKRKKSESLNAKNDLMEGLMQLRDEEEKHLRDVEVLDSMLTLSVAGYVSTALAIMWAFYFLATYPHVLKKLRRNHPSLTTLRIVPEEEQLLVGRKLNGDFITYDDISTCDYMNKVVAEIIRLANISPFLLRKSSKDAEYKGHRIPKGWRVLCWIRYLHTDPENFDDPMCFNPDRWNERPESGKYLVFGAGSRICAGNMLARLQVAILLHHLVVGYRWQLVNPEAGISYLPFHKPTDGVEIDISKI